MNINIKHLKLLIQSSHINFLYGSGLSCGYLSTLGNIENLLTELSKENIKIKKDEKLIIKTSLYASYVQTVMGPCLKKNINKNVAKYEETFSDYVDFLKDFNSIMSHRNVNLIDKQVNLFTTNIDDFMEKAAENAKVEFNDGFKGHITPVFSEDSFSIVKSKSSALYQNNSTIPVFNLLKIHGSINWESLTESEITYDSELKLIERLEIQRGKISSNILDINPNNCTLEELKTRAKFIRLGRSKKDLEEFNQLYSRLVMINPTKAKFRETVIDYHFYELMRLYSNALERSSSLLMVAGFSFKDEHIANITMRAANANPTLEIIVFAYDENAKKSIEEIISPKGLNNDNVVVVSPDDYKKAVNGEDPDAKQCEGLERFDFKSINKYVFNPLVVSI